MRLLSILFIGAAFIASLLPTADAHARLTAPATRPYTYAGGSNAPAWTCTGPAFGTSATSMRCHDVTQSSAITTVTAGQEIEMQWIMEAAHPGDCSVWLSYDANKASPENWIKIKDFPGCLARDGLTPPAGNVKVRIPANLPSCDHCVLRWEWYAVQQVSNVEFYVNCADIKIIGNNNCPLPGPTTAISGIDHLKTNFHTDYPGADKTGCPFYNPYNGGFIQTRSRGALEWVPPTTCNGGGGGATTAPPGSTTTPATTNAPGSTTAAATTSTPPASTAGKGGIVRSTGAKWDGSFTKWVSNDGSFCQCTFGGQCSYICAGGGDAGQGGNCNPVACQSQNGQTPQYSFSATDGWTIKTSKGGNPQRAFGYARVCGDNRLSTCLAAGDVITFSFRFDNVKTWGGYIKIFFFGDGQNVLGLWPNKGMKLVAWPNGDLPQQWQADLTMLEGVWYDVTLTINNFNGGINMAIRENGATLYSGGNWNNNNVQAQERPQVGVYTWSTDGPEFSIKLRNMCAGTATQCKFEYDAAPAPTCPADNGWPSTAAGVQVARPCPVDGSETTPQTPPNMARVCGPDGVWGAVDSSNCKVQPPTTTTPPPAANLCAGVNCGANGICSQSTGKCVCSNGYSGTDCSVAPANGGGSCSVNCAALNRSPCLSNNLCGGCLTNYQPTGSSANSLCQATCNANCDSLNRLSCQTPGSCGVCKSSFTEPQSQSRSEACVATTSTDGENQYSVMIQWKTGYCATLKVKCPFNGKFSFIAPLQSTITSSWNLQNVQKAGTVVAASCPSFAGADYFDAGFCATKPLTNKVSSTTIGYTFLAGKQTTTELADEPLSVSLILALNGANAATVTPSFVSGAVQQLSQSLSISNTAISVQSFTEMNSKLYLTFKITAANSAERDAALDNQLTTVMGFTVSAAESSVVVTADAPAGPETSAAALLNPSPLLLAASLIAAFFAHRF